MATCDAGNGCSITCTNGCGAVYSNGTCTKWCEPSFNAEDIPEGIFEGKFSIEVNDLAIGILAQAIGEKALNGKLQSYMHSKKRVTFKLPSTDLSGLLGELS